MKTRTAANELELRALEALTALLGQVSVFKLTEVKRESPAPGRAFEILVHVDVFGHSHKLACKVMANGESSHLRRTLRDLSVHAANLDGNTTPVLIAPCLPPESQELCNEVRAGFLDLIGNARLFLGETFIGTRSMPCRISDRLSESTLDVPVSIIGPNPLRRFPARDTEIALIA